MYPIQHKRLILAATGMVIALAAVAEAQISDCIPGKLADYERLGARGCTIGHKIFSNFAYHQAPNGPPSSAVSVTPGTVPDSNDSAVLFEATWLTPSSGSSISYDVAAALTGDPLSGASLEMQFGQITGTGQGRVASELRVSTASASICGPVQMTLTVFLGASQSKKATDNGQLKHPARQVCAVTTVSIASGKNGSASMDGFMTVFHSSAALSASSPSPAPTEVGH